MAITLLSGGPHLTTLYSHSQRIHGFKFKCCSPTPNNNNTHTPPLLKLAVNGVTEFLRLLSPSPQTTGLAESREDEFSVSSVDDVLSIIQSDYTKAYFITGNFTSCIYAEDCVFEDPTISFRGRELYARNLKLLVPFFDSASITLQNIEKIVKHVESWNVSALEAIGQIFTFSFGDSAE